MNIENITMNETKKEVALEIFDGVVLHPALDIRNGVLIVGFRCRVKANEDKDIFIIANGENVRLVDSNPIKIGDKSFYIEKRGRKLLRIEEKWSIQGLQKFLSDHVAIRPTIKCYEVFNGLLQRARKYIELEREIDYCLLVAWTLGTYFSPIFYAYPFLHIKAPKRSGKSQCLNFLMQLCFNAMKARPSLPALSDTIDSLHGTYLIDQADSLGMKGREDLLDTLADSYKKSGGKRRVVNLDKRNGREVLEFETYGPKAFASIKELPEDLRDRCLVVPLIRSRQNFPDPDENSEDWNALRGNIYQILIVNHSFISDLYFAKKIQYGQNKEILGRSLELWLPFEVILEGFGMREVIQEAKSRFLAQYGFTEYEPSEVEEEVIKSILNRLENETETIITPKEISELVNVEVFNPSDTPKQRAARVGWAIKKFNLSCGRKSRTKDGVRYLFEKSKVEGIYRSYFKTAIDYTPPAPEPSKAINVEQITV